MARPRAFDEDVVLNAARDLFWAQGYQATSLDDVTRITGVNKPSLYAAFGDKTALFHAVLDRYHAMLLTYAEMMLKAQPSPREGVRNWLGGFLPACSGESGAKGCLSTNTTLEAAALDVETGARLTAYTKKLETLLRDAIKRGIAAGEFSKRVDARGAARMLLATQTGLMVLARNKPTPADTKAAIEYALKLLDM